ncbi:MAG: rod shape-determining protein MreD [Bacteroidia bacterium]|nr:rod shape-determining protein MreD [Bacteroidia bacterium]NND24898.1 rod shape-determining protein MreD [Flavobacteriaceae bacterium]MBT8279063.1 rod shape-determining protein MreD [Bacteroidia bacterium]NNK59963.1 rod shape-determining protein MreD [Flavobacteriaceae bacterium]NNL33084.1 rod shape-determining protein MreD [Flavobacteriaceae bacterium]
MSNTITLHIARFIVLVLVQALVLNNINFLGYINPYIYILFILLYPINNNRMLFIFLSFLLGISVDLFLDSGGVHAGASVFIAYVRPVFLKFSFGATYDHQTVKINTSDIGQRLTYFSLITVVHHLLLFSLEVFNTSKVLLILKKTLFSSIFTIILCVLITLIFSRKPK